MFVLLLKEESRLSQISVEQVTNWSLQKIRNLIFSLLSRKILKKVWTEIAFRAVLMLSGLCFGKN